MNLSNKTPNNGLEALNRAKLLMIYDLSKTYTENLVSEQDNDSKVLNLKGKTIQPGISSKHTSSQASKTKKTLEEFTEDVRNFMSDWKTVTVETLATVIGVGIPIVVGVNGFWMTLEALQAIKGNPDWLSIVFSILATVTAGSQSTVLKPLYGYVRQLFGKGATSISQVLNYLYEGAKKLGIWNKLVPIFKMVKSAGSFIIQKISKGAEWIINNVNFQNSTITSFIKTNYKRLSSYITGILDSMDNWFTQLGTKAGLNPEVASKLGSGVRWGGVPYVIHSSFGDNQGSTGSTFVIQDYDIEPGSYSKQF